MSRRHKGQPETRTLAERFHADDDKVLARRAGERGVVARDRYMTEAGKAILRKRANDRLWRMAQHKRNAFSAALRRIVDLNECLCGGMGYDPGFMTHIEGQEKDTFGHRMGDECPVVVAALALGLKMEVK